MARSMRRQSRRGGEAAGRGGDHDIPGNVTRRNRSLHLALRVGRRAARIKERFGAPLPDTVKVTRAPCTGLLLASRTTKVNGWNCCPTVTAGGSGVTAEIPEMEI